MQQFRIFRALGLSFKAWFSNFIPFTLLAAVLYAPVILWLASIDGSDLDEETLVATYFGRPVYVLIALATLLAPMITYRVIQDLNGNKVSMLTSIKFGWRGILPGLLIAIIMNLLQQIPGGFGGIVGIVLQCIWFVATPAAVAERLGPFAAFSRSTALTSGRRWGIFGLSLLIGLIAVALLAAWIIPMLQSASGPGDVASRASSAAIWFVLVIGVFQMFNGIVQAVAYALLRQDKDGVTYDELAKIFE